jgi:hypothetical protein
VVGREVAVRDPEVPLQLDGIAGGERHHRLQPERRGERDMRPAEISPREPRISVVPFSTSRPRIRAVVLALTL